jgi:hypothetical protein
MASQLQAYDAELRVHRGYGFTEALVETPELSAAYARTLEPERDDYNEEEEEDY